jgi:hypothetical protein
MGDGVAQVLTAAGSQLLEPTAVTHDDLTTSQRPVGRQLAATRDQIDATVGAVKSVIGDGRTIVRSAGNDNGSTAAPARPARKTPVRDAVKNANAAISKVVTKVDSVKSALNADNDDDNNGNNGDGVRAKLSKSTE